MARCRQVLLAAAGGAPLDGPDLAGQRHRRRRLAGAAAGAWPRATGGGAGRAGRCRAPSMRCRSSATTRWCRRLGGAPRYFPAQALPAGARPGRLERLGQTLSRVARHDEHPWNDGLLIEALVQRRPRLLARSHDSRPPQRAGRLDTLGR